ncbi:MAG TPA: M20/M25/M40 family metallo-hydrolase, partial [Candidatus Angelobacter sp.]|nr:M20/M25/M40 family metallo-hydrolase [Candidatus Angelobacter sp.]
MMTTATRPASKIKQPRLKLPFVQHGIEATLAVFCIALIAALTIWIQAPLKQSATRAETEFSVDQSLKHVKAISQKPHPVGSDEHANVQRYIVDQLGKMGLIAQVQLGQLMQDWGGGNATGASIENIWARLDGAGATKSILLCAHYDTVPTSSGAADDSAGVATILEVVRAIHAGPRLKHDVVVLFSDAEEIGLLGSRDFLKQQSWVNEIGLVINMDARGDRGSSLMFETSPQNGWLISQLAKSSARPVTNSLMYEVYKRMPNGTDLTTFKSMNLAGLNFAFIDGSTSYHAASDDLSRLDPRSLQDQGDSVLGLVRHFGNLDAINIRASNQIFFNGPGRVFLHYPGSWSFPFIIAGVLWLVILLIKRIHKGEATWAGLSAGLLYLLMSAVLSYCLVAAVTHFVQSGDFERQFTTNYASQRYNAAFVSLTLSVCCGLYVWFRRRVSIWSMLLGALIMLALLAAAATLWAPGASYFFIWPLLCTLLCTTAVMVRHWTSPRWLQRVIVVIPLIAVLFLVVPTTNLILIGLGLTLSKVVTPLVVLFGTLGITLIELCGVRSIAQIAFLAAGIGIGMMLWGIAGTRESALQPGIDSMSYLVDPGKNRATWASLDAEPDSWTAQYLTRKPQRMDLRDYLPDATGKYLRTSAPVVSLAPPEANLIEDSGNQDGRTFRFRFRSIRRAPVLGVYLDGRESRIISVEADG